ncbi:hypothetical protein QYE76_062272, partial [Lolium multiflorum]
DASRWTRWTASRGCLTVDGVAAVFDGGSVVGVFDGGKASRNFFGDSLTRLGYFEVDRNGDGQKRQTTVAKNILRYLPVLPRIQRLFMTEDTAQQMRWAVEGNRYTDKMIHPSDGTAWKNFVKKFPLKAGDPRSVAVAISTDGFNPYGPKYPGKNMNVYLEPLVDDLVRGWEADDDDEEEDQEHHGGGRTRRRRGGRRRGGGPGGGGGGEDQEEEDLSEDEGLGNLVFDPDQSLHWKEPADYQYVPAVERLRPRDRKPYRRGITQLPALKDWRYRHVVLQPYGRSSFQYEDPSQRPPRGYSNILGGILRWYFPGIVNLPTGGCDVAWRWAHYSLAEDPLGRGTAADLVVAKFWRYFKRAEGKENACDDVLHQLARKRVTGMHYEARIQCVRDWHADRFVHMTKEDACDTLMQPWQYLQNPPQYVGNDDRCFLAMVMWWTCPQYLKKHEEGKKKRAEMLGGSHIQGSIPISLHLQKEVIRTGAKPNVFAVLKKMKQRKTPDPETGSVWVNPQSETQCTSYVSKFKETPATSFGSSCRAVTGGDGSEGAGGPGAKGADGAADSAVPAAADTDDAADATAAADDAAAAAQMSWLMSQTVLTSPPGSLPAPPYLPWMPPPATQTPGTPITVNNMNIIRSMNRGESSYTCAQPATCTCSSVQYANANVHSINLVDYMSQGNDDEAGGSGGGQ